MILNEFGRKRNIKKVRRKLERSGKKNKDELLAKLDDTDLSHIHKIGDETAGHITSGKGKHGTSNIVVTKNKAGEITNVGSHDDVYPSKRRIVKNHSGTSGFKKKRELRPQTSSQILNQRIAMNRKRNNVSENHLTEILDKYFENKYNKECQEGLLGGVARNITRNAVKNTAQNAARNAVKNNVASKIKQKMNSTPTVKNIKNNYQNKKMNVVNNMRKVSNDIDNDETAQQFLPMVAKLIPSAKKESKQYENLSEFKMKKLITLQEWYDMQDEECLDEGIKDVAKMIGYKTWRGVSALPRWIEKKRIISVNRKAMDDPADSTSKEQRLKRLSRFKDNQQFIDNDETMNTRAVR